MKKYSLKNVTKKFSVYVILVGLASCQNNTDNNSVAKNNVVKDTIQSEEETIKRGEYLVTTLGCGDCHSPKKINEHGIPYQDPELMLSGHPQNLVITDYDKQTSKNWVLFNMHNTAVVGPWGTSYAANITSDATGIGNWTEEQFFKAMKEGKFKGIDGTRPLMPPMPWQNYSSMTHEDLHSIFLFLKSTKPVSNIVPSYQPPVQ